MTLTVELREKIERRSCRAWRDHRRGGIKRFSRITDVTAKTLLYRIPDGEPYSSGWYGTKKLEVSRAKDVITIKVPPRDPMIIMLTKSDLSKLENHTGRVRAFKYTDENAQSPTSKPKITYYPGDKISVDHVNTDPSDGCAAGINLASQDWIESSIDSDSRVFAIEFEIEDLAVVPSLSRGKFRVHRCEIMEELHPTTFKPLKALPYPPKKVEPIIQDRDPLTVGPRERNLARKEGLEQCKKAEPEEAKQLPAPEEPQAPATAEDLEKPLVPAKLTRPKKKGFWGKLRDMLGG